MEGRTILQYRPIDELADRLVRRSRGQDVSRDMGRVVRGRQEIEGQGPPVWLRTGARLWRQPWVALSAVVVVWGRRGGTRRQGRSHPFRRDRRRHRFRPQILPRYDVRGRPRL